MVPLSVSPLHCFLLLHHFMHGVEDEFAAEGGVDAEVVVVGVAPGLVGVVIIVVGAAAIGAGDGGAGLCFIHIFCADDARYTALERRVQEEADAAVVIAQDIIGAATDDDAVAASGKIADDFCLSAEDDVLRCVVAVGIDIHLIEKIVDEVAAHAFLVFLDVVFGIAGDAGGLGDDLLVVKIKAELEGEILTNGMAAAAVLTADGDHPAAVLHLCIGWNDVALDFGDGAVENVDLATKEPSDIADEKSGDEGAFANAVESVRKNERKHDGDDGHGDVVGDLGVAKIGVPGGADGAHEGFAGKHGDVGEHLKIHTKAEDDAACQQEKDLFNIQIQAHVFYKNAGKIDGIAKDDADRDLQRVLKLKIAPENDELRKHHEHIHGDGKFAEAEGKIEAQHIRHGRDRRGAEIGFGDDADAERIDKDTDEKQNVTF